MMPQATYETDCTEAFRQAMNSSGIVTLEPILPDSRLHRVHVHGDKPGSKNGWYVLYGDGLSAGVFGNWKTGQKRKWCSRNILTLNETERETFTRRMEQARQQRQNEETRIHTKASQKAYKIWQQATETPPDHPYLMNKSIHPYGLRVTANRQLIVPVRGIDGTLHGLQFIDSKGAKRFLTGTTKKGSFHLIGKPDGTVYIAEGYATAASIHQATGMAVAVAFDAGNLKPVALNLKQKFPDAELIICADNDQWTDNNPGVSKARAAAAAIGAKMAIPHFNTTDSHPTDFNDLHQLEGLEAVREQLGKAEYSDDNQEWPEPEPLNPASLTTAADFPVDALPDMIGEAVTEYQTFGQQPMAMVASSALAMVSLATQCHADVERSKNLRGPISLNFLQQAESGERKTAADRTFSAGARGWLREEQLETEDLKLLGMATLKAWEATEAGLLHDIKRCKEFDAKKVLEEDLREHYKEKPDPIHIPEMFLSDCNPASLMRDLSENPLHGIAVWADEGGLVIGGDGGRDDNITAFIALLNVLWDGSAVSQRRISGNRTIDNRRLTVNIMAQKQVIQKLITGQSGLARGMGLLARFLLCAPPSTIGTRFFRESGTMNSVKTFNERARTLLAQQPRTDEKGRLDPPALTLSQAAFDIWREFFNDIEQSMAPHGDLETVKDVASKTAENAARLAGCFHVFGSSSSSGSASSTALKSTLVDADTMRQACKIAMFYLSEARRVFGYIDTPREIIDAERVLSWWQSKRHQKPILSKGELRREGPIRNNDRLNAALMTLEQAGYMQITKRGGTTTGVDVQINPIINTGGPNHG